MPQAHQHSANDLHALFTALGVFIIVSVLLAAYAVRALWPPLPTRTIVPRVILALSGTDDGGQQQGATGGYMSLGAADSEAVDGQPRRRTPLGSQHRQDGWRVDMSKHRATSYLPPAPPGHSWHGLTYSRPMDTASSGTCHHAASFASPSRDEPMPAASHVVSHACASQALPSTGSLGGGVGHGTADADMGGSVEEDIGEQHVTQESAETQSLIVSTPWSRPPR
eukprot:CAMPEP_0174727278 /NCGR_PEP_ID=MMETSP1094-20130205/49446_1 /TAXON_ID=156173 /ORGANISM="Chrysochromulina brevifilum, Strain UTEX LB 985" /LENGTH=223 /DNA_ID=CAMNT_0015928981 /DNA_START=121 /DNA_END=789 /DNA_ORIENTATION=+